MKIIISTSSFIIALVVFLLILIYLYAKLTCGRCKCNTYLAGKTALIAGGNSGIGYQTALALAGRGCRVIIADKDNCDESKRKIIEITGNSNVITKELNLASFNSIRKFAKDINDTEERLDILINNAGISNKMVHTEDGLDQTMQVNHFGPFLLTHLLIDLLKKSAPSRIIYVSSLLAYIHNLTVENLNSPGGTLFPSIVPYANSKLCNIITADYLAEKLCKNGITVNSVHPGLVYTTIYSKHFKSFSSQQNILLILLHFMLRIYGKVAEEGAQTTIHLALCKGKQMVTGKYLVDCASFRKPSKANDKAFTEQIWKASEKYARLKQQEIL